MAGRVITPTALDMGSCRDCKARVMWAKTETGRNLPVDPTPDDTGNVLIERDVAGVLQAWTLGPNDTRPGQRYMPHFATCPNPQRRTPKPKPRRKGHSR